jgi:NTE family protein
VAVALGATRVIVLPTGFSCEIEKPPTNPIAMALHGLTLLIARQLIVDIELLTDAVELRVVPPLCPLPASPYDFAGVSDMIDRAEESTRKWLDHGGLEQMVIPPQMQERHLSVHRGVLSS